VIARAIVIVAAVAAPAAADPDGRVGVAGEIFAGGAFTHTVADDVTAFELERGEVGIEPAYGERGFGELRLESVRSAAPQSGFGIDGNSLLVRVKRAWGGGRAVARDVTFEGRAGLIADPWIEAIERGYDLRALAPTVAEGAALVESSDLGVAAIVGWRDRVRLHLSYGNGEGRAQLEQNRGKSTSVALSVRAAELAGASLDATCYGRDGSIGLGAVRSHRLGCGVTLTGIAGVELVRAWGVGDRTDVTAVAFGAWASHEIAADAGAAVRIDHVTTGGPGDADGRTITSSLAAWYDVVPDGVRAYLAGQLVRNTGLGATLPGVTDATDQARVLLVIAAGGRAELR